MCLQYYVQFVNYIFPLAFIMPQISTSLWMHENLFMHIVTEICRFKMQTANSLRILHIPSTVEAANYAVRSAARLLAINIQLRNPFSHPPTKYLLSYSFLVNLLHRAVYFKCENLIMINFLMCASVSVPSLKWTRIHFNGNVLYIIMNERNF